MAPSLRCKSAVVALLCSALVACGASDETSTPRPSSTAGSGGGSAQGGAAGDAGAAGTTAGGAAGKATIPVRIATFNTENFFNDKIDGEPGIQDEAMSTPTTAAYQAKLKSVAQILALTKADIFALQEVENQAVLDDLAQQAELGSSYPTRVLIPGNDPRGIDVALMSIYPTVEVISHKNELFTGSQSMGDSYKFSRDCLEVHLAINGVRLIVLVSHFKAKLADNPQKRLAEAERTRAIADAASAKYPDAAVLIIGDFNDFPQSPPIDALQGKAPTLYTSAALNLPPADAWSVTFNGQPRLHDDHRANPLLEARRIAGSTTIIHDPMLPTKQLQQASDHSPVVSSYAF